MKIIPAIDLLDNQAVRLFKGDFSQKTVYSDSPWDLVKAFEKTGAELIHLVDLNGARSAAEVNKDTIRKMRESSSLRIQLGGGIRDMDKLKYYRDLGIDRFIIGTTAVTHPGFVDEALHEVGQERVVIAVDAYNGNVRISGWEEDTKLHYETLLKRLENQGITEIVFTDISQDGTLSGPNLDSYRTILENYKFNLIASGGIASMKDIMNLIAIRSNNKLFGIITGKAIYEGKLDLKEAISSMKKQA
ncbi:MAG: 1-(5-phosphoribosyl)-5-[(5-phosphoribosylamino)methylideneamino]imidazole-4-carboxamide isomerase [Leptospiraceae bacterium]|nr:1-(5-phosphoribosyl)-5-[(5-phosphoribosylamino)methylideneamino]imidazole-4-carboxamide isomerase [Leptospiraceae bacterium]MCP5511517.1 1-(5-phosphoribosyl)-5-[(5-phosphoribosylamino)methylideneamino]imidazole-4-carboxamide isomerase [Leptospiraceae bacterium]